MQVMCCLVKQAESAFTHTGPLAEARLLCKSSAEVVDSFLSGFAYKSSFHITSRNRLVVGKEMLRAQNQVKEVASGW